MIKKIGRLILKLFFTFLIVSIGLVLLYRFVSVPFTPLMGIRYFEPSGNTMLQHKWVPINKISNYALLAVVCAEDQNFTTHNGFDIKAIEKALESNKSSKRKKGASTISQQTAKNVFLWPNRTWVRKGFEAYFTFLIENLWSKERILEVYLNSIEMGPKIFGIQAASKYWFNKDAEDLTKEEAASIAAILPNPLKYKASPASNYIQKRKIWIVNQMYNYGKFTLDE